MSITIPMLTVFPQLDEEIITLTNKNGMTIKLSNYGATWLSCVIPIAGVAREMLLGCASLAEYKQQTAYLGATVGRYANRIANAMFNITGKQYMLTANQGKNQLHGGISGFDKRLWSIQNCSSEQVTFCLVSPDGEEGFPGKLTVAVTYQLTSDNSVSIQFMANTNKATPVNLTNHAYFNLDGDSAHSDEESRYCDARLQSLQIHADHYLLVDADGIPTGDLMPVMQHDMDLRQPKRLIDHFWESHARRQTSGYDHTYLLHKKQPIAATLTSADGTVAMDVITSLPALHVYSGNFLQGTPNRWGGAYQNFAGIALEAQFLPDSPNHPEWPQPSCFLHPHQTYQHEICYRFHSKT
ncbi:galactose-1-epimerase [Orbaceae bacterium ESL0727]|nr:galactose-1-epimerase [Orbaceae bacterium ESL0727]